MKMTESKKLGFQGSSILLITIGLIMFLSDTSHSGHAIESCRLSLSVTACSMIGAALMILSAAVLLILYLRNK